MKILLINPNYHCGGAEIPIGTMTPLGLLYLGGSLIDANHTVKLIDGSKYNYTEQEILEFVKKENPSMVCVGSSMSTATIEKCIFLIKKIKTININIYTVLGGIHPTFLFLELMKQNNDIDFIIRGEGEMTIKELSDAIDEDKDVSKIDGLVWRKAGDILVNQERDVIDNLNSIRAAWELIEDFEVYRNFVTKELTAVIQFSRGCPYKCSFCGQWQFWKKYRVRSPDLFVDEIELLNKKYGVTYFFFADENPSANAEQWYTMLKVLASRNLHIHIAMNLRVTDVIRDSKYLWLYKKVGISHVDLGVEATDNDTLKTIKKETTTNENQRAIMLLKKHQILTIVNLLVGERTETKKSLDKKFQAVIKWDPDLVLPYIIVPYPWTLTNKYYKNWIVDKNFSNWNYVTPIIELENYERSKFLKDLISNLVGFLLKKLVNSFFKTSGKYRKITLRAFIFKGIIYYIYQHIKISRPLLKCIFGKKRPLFVLYGTSNLPVRNYKPT